MTWMCLRKILQIVVECWVTIYLSLAAALTENLNQMDEYYTVKDLKYADSKGRTKRC